MTTTFLSLIFYETQQQNERKKTCKRLQWRPRTQQRNHRRQSELNRHQGPGECGREQVARYLGSRAGVSVGVEMGGEDK